MLSDDDYLDLPEDPELAFLQLERAFRETLQGRIDSAANGIQSSEYYSDYIVDAAAAAEALGVGLAEWRDLRIVRDNSYSQYKIFSTQVQKFTLSLRIKHSHRLNKYSVPLNDQTRGEIQEYLTKLRALADKLEIPDWKRVSILAKISELATELERPRARFEVVASFLLEAASVGGQIGEKLEPWRKWIDSIARLIGTAKESETKSLPAPEKQKELPAPATQTTELDDEIPF